MRARGARGRALLDYGRGTKYHVPVYPGGRDGWTACGSRPYGAFSWKNESLVAPEDICKTCLKRDLAK